MCLCVHGGISVMHSELFVFRAHAALFKVKSISREKHHCIQLPPVKPKSGGDPGPSHTHRPRDGLRETCSYWLQQTFTAARLLFSVHTHTHNHNRHKHTCTQPNSGNQRVDVSPQTGTAPSTQTELINHCTHGGNDPVRRSGEILKYSAPFLKTTPLHSQLCLLAATAAIIIITTGPGHTCTTGLMLRCYACVVCCPNVKPSH